MHSHDLRRLIVNASYFLTGLQELIDGEANVVYIGNHEPSALSFGAYKKGVKPSNHELRN